MHSAGIVSQSSFSQVSAPKPQRSAIPVKTGRKHTMNAGYLVPVMHEYCLPGDDWNLQIGMFGRLLTLRFPLMDNLILDWFAFFVPERIIWDNFEKMQGFQENPGDSVDYVFPWLVGEDSDTFEVQPMDLGDYLGLPTSPINATQYFVRSGFFRAYRSIWNDWFRDQNYQDTLPLSGSSLDPRGDGPDPYVVVSELLRRNKRPDYFSSSLPAPQKGPAVQIPMEGSLPVWGDGGSLRFYRQLGSDDDTFFLQNASSSNNAIWSTSAGATSNMNVVTNGDEGPSGLLADASAIVLTVNQMRENIVLQQIYELDMRGGTRYVEALRMRWNTDPQDSRLQRPEYISGGSSEFSVSQVAQTTPGTEESPMAELSAYSELRSTGRVSYSCVEHGHLIILANVRAPLTYQEGLNRKHLARSRFDLPEPLTMNLGERAVMQYEIFYPPSGIDAVFGYQEIWAEYRYSPSFVTGAFRSTYPGTLDPWHLALRYETAPVHNATWVEDHPPVDRVVAFDNEPQLKLDFIAKGVVARQMPVVSTPGLMRL